MAVSPTVRQRQLGMRLRSIRLEQGMTVEEVAGKLLISASKISRLETATRPPNPRDVRDLCQFYKVDTETTAELMDLARKGREPGWWNQYGDLRLEPYIGLEQDASSITCFAAYYIPALLQTEDYGRAIIKGVAPKMDPAVCEDRLEVRLRRQQLLEHPEPPRYRALIDEAVLQRPAGGPEVMAAQIDKVLKLVQQRRITVNVIPFSVGVLATQDSNFVLLDFDDSTLSPVVFIEGLTSNQILEKKTDVDRYIEATDHLRDSALSPRDSISYMVEKRKSYIAAS